MAVWKKTKDHEARYFTQNDFEMRKVTEEYWCRYGIVRKDRNHVTMPHGYLVIIRKYREFKQVYENGIFVTINGRVVRTHIANGDLYLQVFSSITKRMYKISIDENKTLNIQNPRKHIDNPCYFG